MQTPTMFSIFCTPQPVNWLKEEDLWCFDYTFPNGTSVKDEPLMPDATELVNRLLEHKYGENSSISLSQLFSCFRFRDNASPYSLVG